MSAGADIREGYLVIADITGFISDLAETELDHAQAVTRQVRSRLVDSLVPPARLVEVEGDAVFVHPPADEVTRGGLVPELVESTCADFRDLRETMVRNATCPCRACRAIPGLDLKFVARLRPLHPGWHAVHRPARGRPGRRRGELRAPGRGAGLRLGPGPPLRGGPRPPPCLCDGRRGGRRGHPRVPGAQVRPVGLAERLRQETPMQGAGRPWARSSRPRWICPSRSGRPSCRIAAPGTRCCSPRSAACSRPPPGPTRSSSAAVAHHGVTDTQVLPAFDLQAIGPGARVDGIAAPPAVFRQIEQ